MAPVLPSDRPTESAYRPLSGLALAGFFLSCLYAVALTVLFLISWIARKPPFLELWTLLVPATAITLAWMGRQQIRHAEGTRSGDSLVAWGLRLSIGYGAVYAAYYLAIYLTVYLQAGHFVQDWLAKLQKGDVNNAFLLTLDPDQRQDLVGGDQNLMMIRFGQSTAGQKGPLLVFQENEYIRLLRLPGTTVENLGIREWDYQQGGYRVDQVYRLRTPEGIFQLQVVVHGKDAKGGRRWRIADNETALTGQPILSPLGQSLQAGRQDARRFASDWVRQLTSGDRLGLFLGTRPAFERPRLRRASQACLATLPIAGGAVAALGQPLTTCVSTAAADLDFIPGFHAFAAGELVRTDSFRALRWKTEILADAKAIFQRHSVLQGRLADGDGQVLDADRRRFAYYIDLAALSKDTRMPRYVCQARLVVECDPDPDHPDRLQWRWLSLELLRGGDPPGDPSGQAGPRK